DGLAFEEIENEETVADIANELYGNLARNKLYPYACFARGTAAASAARCCRASRSKTAPCTSAISARPSKTLSPRVCARLWK
ncbi:hypothetical protein, partial [Treponema endosymbiont of Eucomonympha sp.]|uniref:hypothetical protein n=1 Tax=Treponema endosymbiont of Eucomonympha sp. TaxID=1580831 RepID=UPI000AA48718